MNSSIKKFVIAIAPIPLYYDDGDKMLAFILGRLYAAYNDDEDAETVLKKIQGVLIQENPDIEELVIEIINSLREALNS